ncbi:MAG: hypothetical protein LBJ67_01150 [Planctomycetaceae bacterium]|jgi:hypothetical protein|nr:hypothetical protein [Planctomycetaceae bacterium]
MDFNFFDWIKNGVKWSVLRGVDEAVQELGTPPSDEESSKDKIFSFLQGNESQKLMSTNTTPARRRLGSGSSSASTRKLGRSIAEIPSE